MKRIISLLTLCVIAIFSCVTLSSCYMPVFGFTITGEGVEITELDNKRYFKGEVITFGADVLDGKEGKIVAQKIGAVPKEVILRMFN